jgi:hypothetical protein
MLQVKSYEIQNAQMMYNINAYTLLYATIQTLTVAHPHVHRAIVDALLPIRWLNASNTTNYCIHVCHV